MNPYKFTRMEWWRNRNRDGLGHAYVGFCENGDKYLTFDVRKDRDIFIPVFSPICKIGSKNGHKEEAYKFYRDQFDTLDGYQIQSVDRSDYKELQNIDEIYKFEI